MALTSDQTIALRLLESLLILVPIWIAVTQYILRTLVNPSKNSDGQGPREVIAIAFIYLSYLILVLSLTGIRAILSPVIDSASLLVVIDLIILFIFVVAIILYLSVIEIDSDIIAAIYEDFLKTLEDHGYKLDGDVDLYILSLVASLMAILLVVYWLLLGGLMLDILAWVLDRIYIRW